MELKELRAKVSRIDNEILSLLLERLKIISEIGRYKREHALPVFSPERDREVAEMIEHTESESSSSLRLLYGMVLDLSRFNEYMIAEPEEITIPTGLGGASVRAILPDNPGALCRYLSPLAAAEVSIADIHSSTLPGGKLVVDLELTGDTNDPRFVAALSVLANTAEKFALL